MIKIDGFWKKKLDEFKNVLHPIDHVDFVFILVIFISRYIYWTWVLATNIFQPL